MIKQYKKELLLAVCYIGVLSLASVLFQDIMISLGILIGGCISILGFLYIVVMVERLDFQKRTVLKVVVHYFIRYFFYCVSIYFSYMMGVNILTIVIGFLCMNFGIIVNTKLEERRRIH